MDNFMIGLLGALAPESWRLYNLRNQPQVAWSWRYVVFTIPFLLVGGAIAYVLEPSTKWGAFYAGLTAPILLTTVMKDTAKAELEYEALAQELAKEKQRQEQLAAEKQALLEQLAAISANPPRGVTVEGLPSTPPVSPPLVVAAQPLSEESRLSRTKGQGSWGRLLVAGGLVAGGVALALSQPFWTDLGTLDVPSPTLPKDHDILLSYKPPLVGPVLLLLGLGLGGLSYYLYRQRRRAADGLPLSMLDRFLAGLP